MCDYTSVLPTSHCEPAESGSRAVQRALAPEHPPSFRSSCSSRCPGWAALGCFAQQGWLCLPPLRTCGEIARWHGQPDEVHKSFWHCISAISWTVKEAPVIKIHSETQLEDCSFSKANVMHSFCLGSFSSLSHSLWTRVIKQAWCSPIIFTLKAINQDWLRKWRQLSKISYVTRVRLK